MENYIRCYDNVVSDDFCDSMIKQFETFPLQHEKNSQGEKNRKRRVRVHRQLKKFYYNTN